MLGFGLALEPGFGAADGKPVGDRGPSGGNEGFADDPTGPVELSTISLPDWTFGVVLPPLTGPPAVAGLAVVEGSAPLLLGFAVVLDDLGAAISGPARESPSSAPTTPDGLSELLVIVVLLVLLVSVCSELLLDSSSSAGDAVVLLLLLLRLALGVVAAAAALVVAFLVVFVLGLAVVVEVAAVAMPDLESPSFLLCTWM